MLPEFELRLVELLEDLRDIGLFASGADLVRSASRSVVTRAAVDEVAATVLTAVPFLQANGRRKGAAIYNDSAATLYLKLGPGASASDWTVKLSEDDYYELPADYRGEVSGVFSAGGNGQARVTEYGW